MTLIDTSYKSVLQVIAIEAPIVGFFLVLIFSLIFILLNLIPYFKQMHMLNMLLSTFLSGALFHIICEYIGLNTWYSKKYCTILGWQKKE